MPARKEGAPDRCHNLERKIMKIQTTLTRLLPALVLAAVLSVCTATSPRAIAEDPRTCGNCQLPVGLAREQSISASVFNSSEDRAIIINGGKFQDSQGTILAEFGRTTVAPQHMVSLTLDRETLMREESRIQISAVVTFPSMPDLRDARVSVEVIDNATGKTTVLFGD